MPEAFYDGAGLGTWLAIRRLELVAGLRRRAGDEEGVVDYRGAAALFGKDRQDIAPVGRSQVFCKAEEITRASGLRH